MQEVVERFIVSEEQYNALQVSVVLPTPFELFDYQVSRLKEKGFDLSKKEVDDLVVYVPENPQFFLVLPSKSDKLDLEGLMHLVEIKGTPGKVSLDIPSLGDLEEVQPKSHLLLDVEDGRRRHNITPGKSREH